MTHSEGTVKQISYPLDNAAAYCLETVSTGEKSSTTEKQDYVNFRL
jgi:hypothetical protein